MSNFSHNLCHFATALCNSVANCLRKMANLISVDQKRVQNEQNLP